MLLELDQPLPIAPGDKLTEATGALLSERLFAHGYGTAKGQPIKPSARLAKKLSDAIKALQQARRMEPTGHLDASTWKLLCEVPSETSARVSEPPREPTIVVAGVPLSKREPEPPATSDRKPTLYERGYRFQANSADCHPAPGDVALVTMGEARGMVTIERTRVDADGAWLLYRDGEARRTVQFATSRGPVRLRCPGWYRHPQNVAAGSAQSQLAP